MSQEAEDVWSSIVAYRHDSAKTIEKAYGNNKQKIVKTLESYPGKGKYHGHQTGQQGDATAGGADINLNAAIKFLNEHVPKEEEEKGKAGNAEKKGTQVAKDSELIKIIHDNDNLGKVQELLDAKNPNWKNIRVVKESYDSKKLEKAAAKKKK